MKKLISGIAALVMIALAFASCKRYDDGPSLTLASKKSRISNDWVLDKYYAGDQDITTMATVQSVWSGTVWSIEKNGKYSVSGGWVDTGTWSFTSKKGDVTFASSSGTTTDYVILKLESKSLWMEVLNSSGSYDKLYFKQK